MLIFERSINRAEADVVQRYVLRCLKTGRCSVIGKTGVTRVPDYRDNPTVLSYAVLDEGQPVAWLKLKCKPGWAAFEVKHVWVEPEYRGCGLTESIYRAAINHDGIMIASGITQTKWARALWARFVRDDIFHIWAQDLNDLDRVAPVFYDEGEVYTSLPHLYTRDFKIYKKHDVRLIAVKKPNAKSTLKRRN